MSSSESKKSADIPFVECKHGGRENPYYCYKCRGRTFQNRDKCGHNNIIKNPDDDTIGHCVQCDLKFTRSEWEEAEDDGSDEDDAVDPRRLPGYYYAMQKVFDDKEKIKKKLQVTDGAGGVPPPPPIVAAAAVAARAPPKKRRFAEGVK